MLSQSDARRRWLGLVFLAIAFGLLVWGQTVLKPHLDGMLFLVYWAGCFLFTTAAIFVALLDMRAMRRRTRQEHRDLVVKTIEELDAETRHLQKDQKPAATTEASSQDGTQG